MPVFAPLAAGSALSVVPGRLRDAEHQRRRQGAAVMLLTVMAKQVICGRPWQAIWRSPYGSSCMTCVIWDRHANPPAAVTKKIRVRRSLLLDTAEIDRADLMTHDIGSMVSYGSPKARFDLRLI
ncbi:hypothetical protein J2W29_004198 [Variovorax boronicumulans]|nr:hypothetical protein [Variovorax boronicumulans]